MVITLVVSVEHSGVLIALARELYVFLLRNHLILSHEIVSRVEQEFLLHLFLSCHPGSHPSACLLLRKEWTQWVLFGRGLGLLFGDAGSVHRLAARADPWASLGKRVPKVLPWN
ncbi:unnamed protein product [Prunus armeniaca]